VYAACIRMQDPTGVECAPIKVAARKFKSKCRQIDHSVHRRALVSTAAKNEQRAAGAATDDEAVEDGLGVFNRLCTRCIVSGV
jgi:hypothetical protein